MNMIQKLKKNKKGFTLVELLVVLVILAILAAAIIPSMMGFIDKAKEESHAAECRNVLLGAEVVLNEMYGKGIATDTGDIAIAEVKKISDVPGTISAVTYGKATANEANSTDHYIVTGAKYVTADYNAGYTYAKNATSGNFEWSKDATKPVKP